MKTLLAFMKKEWLEQVRSLKLWICIGVFVVFGAMNPAVAKLTPIILDAFSEALEGSGMTITQVEVTALDSWMQFFKNIPMALIVFVLLQGSIFTKEYGSTLVLSLTKGLDRYKVVIAKSVTLFLLWTGCYWLCFGVTYVGNEFFWSNSIAKNLALSIFNYWLYGVFTIALITLFSTIVNSGIFVLVLTGGVSFGLSLFSFIPKFGKWLPVFLSDGTSLIYGWESAEAYLVAIIVTVVLTVVSFVVSVPLFNKKQV
jgi:ABC-2 type transport system permease protein